MELIPLWEFRSAGKLGASSWEFGSGAVPRLMSVPTKVAADEECIEPG